MTLIICGDQRKHCSRPFGDPSVPHSPSDAERDQHPAPESESAAARTPAVDERLDLLRRWLRGIFGADDLEIAPASADASFRRYFRVRRGPQNDRETWIAMDAPPGKEDIRPYVRVAAMLTSAGVNAPRVIAQDVEQGFVLNTDLGSRTYLSELQQGADPHRLYQDAIDALVRMQVGAAEDARTLPPHDEALLRREMALFTEWFCGRHLRLALSTAELAALASVFDLLNAAALGQPTVFVHRDYHSRNLMVCDGGEMGANPGVLDFQDAVCGPITYDLASLLRDCYIAWPPAQVLEWVALFRARAMGCGLDCGRDECEFLRWLNLMGAQRHLKAIGIFARLAHRDGKLGYLKDIPRTLEYLSAAGAAYSELGFLRAFIEQRVKPALESAATRSPDGSDAPMRGATRCAQ